MEQHLEIFVFTYNRAKPLERTLEQFATGPFSRCKITVLDNHSTDETSRVCERLKLKLPGLLAMRHPKNIGGLANYLRAIELARADYTWVICDDDAFDFSKSADIIAAVRERKSDIISVGVAGHELPGGASGRLARFALEHDFFLSHSFVPSLIFRTELFNSDILRRGYDNIATMFPHFPLLIALVEQDSSFLISREKIITKSNNVGYSTFRFLTGWAQSCRKIHDSSLRRKAAGEVFGGRIFLRNLVYCILTERVFRPAKCWEEYRDLLKESLLLSFFTAAKIALFLPLVLAPRFLIGFFWRRYEHYRTRQGSAVPNFDEHR